MALARSYDDVSLCGQAANSPVPTEQEVCSADFDKVHEWHMNPPKPTLKAVEANKLYHQLLAAT